MLAAPHEPTAVTCVSSTTRHPRSAPHTALRDVPRQSARASRPVPTAVGRLARAARWGFALVPALATAACVFAPGYHVRTAQVMGATEVVRVEQAGLDFVARIDSGAGSTSIHALDVQIEDPEPAMRDNVGKRVRVLVENERGRARWLESVIAEVTYVRNVHQTDARYTVPLDLVWNGTEKRVHVNLRDRTPMSYKLLIGRDWLDDDFLVDVSLNTPGR